MDSVRERNPNDIGVTGAMWKTKRAMENIATSGIVHGMEAISGAMMHGRVTHWMPLPNPPKEGEVMSRASTVGEIVRSDMEQSGHTESDTGNHHLFRLGKGVSTGRNLAISDEIRCFKKKNHAQRNGSHGKSP